MAAEAGVVARGRTAVSTHTINVNDIVRYMTEKRSRSGSRSRSLPAGRTSAIPIHWGDTDQLYKLFLHVDMLHDFLDTRRSTREAIDAVKEMTLNGGYKMKQFVGYNLYGDINYTGEFSNIEDAFTETLLAARLDLLGLNVTNIPIAASEYKPGKNIDECIKSRYIKIPKKANTTKLFQKIIDKYHERSNTNITYTCDASPWIQPRVIPGYTNVKTVSTLLDSATGISNNAEFVERIPSTPFTMTNPLTESELNVTRTPMPQAGREFKVNVKLILESQKKSFDTGSFETLNVSNGPTLPDLAEFIQNNLRGTPDFSWLTGVYNRLSIEEPTLRQKFLFDIKTSQDADQTKEAKDRGIQCFFTVDKLCSMGALIKQIPVVVFCSSDHAMMYINHEILGRNSIDNEIYKIKNILSQNQLLNEKIRKYRAFIVSGEYSGSPLFKYLKSELINIFDVINKFINDMDISYAVSNVTRFVNNIVRVSDGDKNALVQRAIAVSEPLVQLQTIISTIDLLIDDPNVYFNDLLRYEAIINGTLVSNDRQFRRNYLLVSNDDSFLVKVNRLTNLLSFDELYTYLQSGRTTIPPEKTYEVVLNDGSIVINGTAKASPPQGGTRGESYGREKLTSHSPAGGETWMDEDIPTTASITEEVSMDEDTPAATSTAEEVSMDEDTFEITLDDMKKSYITYINHLISVVDGMITDETIGEKIEPELSEDIVAAYDAMMTKDVASPGSKPAAAAHDVEMTDVATPGGEPAATTAVRKPFHKVPAAATGKRHRSFDDDEIKDDAVAVAAPGGEPRKTGRMGIRGRESGWAGGNKHTRKNRIRVKIRRNGEKTPKRRRRTLKHR